MSASDLEQRSFSERGRRSPRTSGDERERAILRTAEELLASQPLSRISVDALARGAGISRSAFYFYFPSKDAVVLSLLDEVVREAAAARDEALREGAALGPDSCRQSIAIFYETFGAHRALIRAAVELSATNTEAQGLRSQIMEGWVQHVVERIALERGAGIAPDGPPARALATALVQMNERVLQAVFTEMSPAVSESDVIEILVHIWVSAIYSPSGAALAATPSSGS